MLTPIEIVLWVVYFISLYFTVFWLLVFVENEPSIYSEKKALGKTPFVTILVPAYNEEDTIKRTLDSCLNLDYPSDKLEIIVVNDGSEDSTAKIVKTIIGEHERGKLVRLINQDNSGKAVSLNKGLRLSKGEFFVCLDADSVIESGALKHLLPEFDNPKVAIALPLLKAARPLTLLQRLQYTEYLVNIFYKKIMGYLDCIHVAPGPFSVYRKDILLKVGSFDEGSITEDLEIAVRLQKRGYKIVQNMEAVVYTNTPSSFREFYAQRNRWFKGGVLTALKHKELFFNTKYGDFGIIQFPILLVSGFLSLTLLVAFAYYALKPNIEYLVKMGLVNYDFLTFIKTISLKINLFNLDLPTLTIFAFTILITSYVLYLSFFYTREKLGRRQGYSLPVFIFLYFFILSFTWLGVIKDLIFRKFRW